MVLTLAETTGVWPVGLKCISVTSIAKHERLSTPDDTRAIAVASVIYSRLWGSLRFRQLTDWMSHGFPPTLLGSIPTRSAFTSEYLLDGDLHQESEDPNDWNPMVLFIDRYKCFDLLVPDLVISVASELGLPWDVSAALHGFYQGQVRIFKLGTAYRRKVFSSNAILQGC